MMWFKVTFINSMKLMQLNATCQSVPTSQDVFLEGIVPQFCFFCLRSLRRHSRYHCDVIQGTMWRCHLRSLGTDLETKVVKFTGFIDRPLPPKQEIPHPITIQNMRFDRTKKLCDYYPYANCPVTGSQKGEILARFICARCTYECQVYLCQVH